MEKRDRTGTDGGASSGAYDPFAVSVDSMLGNAKLNTAALGPSAGLAGSNILFREDTVGGVRRRSWNERLFYGVGTTYLIGARASALACACAASARTGARTLTRARTHERANARTHERAGITAGSVWGFYEGLRHPDGRTARLRVNSVLNSVTRRGPFLGNSLGVLGTARKQVSEPVARKRGG